MSEAYCLSRRSALKFVGAAGAAGLAARMGGGAGSDAPVMAPEPPRQSSDLRQRVFSKVWSTPLIDTHEHLCDEHDRLPPAGASMGADDWAVVLAGYLGSDLLAAAMPADVHRAFYSKGPSPAEKWKLLEPYWPAKNTGYGQAARISLRQLYGVDDLSAIAAEKAQAGDEQLRRPGFYRRILCQLFHIESCQVNWLKSFCEPGPSRARRRFPSRCHRPRAR